MLDKKTMEHNDNNIKTVIGAEYGSAILDLINSAIVTIDIMMFDWRWYDQDPSNPIQLINQAIVRAVRRGVVVRAITSSPKLIDILRSVGIDARKLDRAGLMHSKIIIVDRCFYSMGSHNLTDSANTRNIESSIIVRDQLTAQVHLDYFNNLWSL